MQLIGGLTINDMEWNIGQCLPSIPRNHSIQVDKPDECVKLSHRGDIQCFVSYQLCYRMEPRVSSCWRQLNNNNH